MADNALTPVVERTATAPTLTRLAGSAFVPTLAALQFLTVIPALVRRPLQAAEMGRAVGFFPLVGVLLGAALFGLHHLASWLWPAGVAAALVLASWVLLTGGLHVDGFVDTCDGLCGGHTPEDRLRIMRDPRRGAFAVAGGIVLMLVKYQALVAAGGLGLLLAPVLGRVGMTAAICAFPYARAQGLGRDIKDHAGRRQALLAALTVGIVIALVDWLPGLIALAVAALTTVVIATAALRMLGGLTGDVYGAICELCETAVLLALAARLSS